MRIIQLALRGLQFLWTLLIMSLIGNMIAEAYAGNPATVNYTMFVAAFSMLSLFYLIPASVKPDWAIHPILLITLDTLNMIFFLTAGIALAAKLECHSCGNQSYILSNEITNGSHNPGKRCREAQASTAFLWFGWAAYAGSWVVSILMSRQSGANLRPRVGPARGSRGGPSMAQV
ncbi:membrane-associating domain-containing protein [Aspergillus karnatakaensis]|uniref:MARVEL domain-containing protein n=1 Tax=Aspergillus karnatakaensis TaxID=1810916 RepID=UPI003CCD6FCC